VNPPGIAREFEGGFSYLNVNERVNSASTWRRIGYDLLAKGDRKGRDSCGILRQLAKSARSRDTPALIRLD
jgi:hypothetical protein